ncbi:hypothetical protein LTR78_001052 [Recurvomyces mirabilis]|uniref:Uncharacterized protein n=1 Tax=Recurvomyces mirabilis TaxID=574656 RepID=A0AAE0WX80_9PEZI|nr:hypothetical protein LTR78_001052 [Recurvomyces mirabilis]KAK5159024.1 hypothetical protein LTS14_003132 [Recurvomyces mirabilis]
MNADYYRSDPYLHDEHVHHSLERYPSRHSPQYHKYEYPMNDLDLDDYYERRRLAPHYRDFRGYDRDCRWGSDEQLRRANREAAILNSQIRHPRQGVHVHPMVTFDGMYPPSFRRPRRLEDFVFMENYDLDEIMMAYELGRDRRRYYNGAMASRCDDDGDHLYSTQSGRRRDLIALFEFLGAHQLVECLRYS